MIDEYELRNDMETERYKSYLEAQQESQLNEIWDTYPKRKKIELIQSVDATGQGDGCYEG